jgi:LacI family transcriptional regulator
MNKSKVVTKDKPAVNDIARHAGVSLATVDRVLNARPGVRKVTNERVTNERTFLDTRRIVPFDPQSIVNALDALEPDNADGLAIIAPETPVVRDAIDRARERGLSVVALLSDLPSSQCDHFIGIDNTSAGQTAG